LPPQYALVQALNVAGYCFDILVAQFGCHRTHRHGVAIIGTGSLAEVGQLLGNILRVLAAQVREKNLSVRKLERLVQILQQAPAPSSGKPQKSPHIQELEHDMTRILGTRVTIHTARRTAHRGKIIIEFYNLDDFDRIREKLQ